MTKKLIVTFASITLLMTSLTTSAAITDSTADLVHVRKNCTGINNCVSSMSDVLDWLWGNAGNATPRLPTAENPVIVDIGAGTFSVPSTEFFCNNQGNVTFRGSGHDNTVLAGGGFSPNVVGLEGEKPVIAVNNCSNFTVQDLTIQSDGWLKQSGSIDGVLWSGGGNSTWSNITIEAAGIGWYDIACPQGATSGEHYLFGSKIHTRVGHGDAVSYVSECGDNWFYGGELKSIVDGFTTRVAGAIALTENGKLQIFGSSVRVHSTEGRDIVNASIYTGLYAGTGAAVHMHGGIISVRADLENPPTGGFGAGYKQNVYGATAEVGSRVHTLDTAFVVIPGGSGITHRALGTGIVQSPFQWPPSNDIPRSPNTGAPVLSVMGSDTFVETDCSSLNGSCSDGSGNEPHLMIYSDNCNVSGPWFDSTRGKCREAP